MLHKELTEKILGACFEVSNELGCGFLESVYEKALSVVLKSYRLKVESQAVCKVNFRHHCVGEFRADLLVEDKVIVELKAVKAIAPEHFAQTMNYLKVSGLDVGLLVNFGRPRLEYQRIHTPVLSQKNRLATT
ncbi:GxxExxY protein [Deltaproteobacteria bacterium IMCC39524]|nr:GxxExxY protein [Deltaproteobacteria bacterium IMCC39524]